ncbi:S41 family peptidase [Poriferisphaera corsica]|nr:S41 family peptidase [Poriferisphaera corsica]
MLSRTSVLVLFIIFQTLTLYAADAPAQAIQPKDKLVQKVEVLTSKRQIQAWQKLSILLQTKYAYRDQHNIDWQYLCDMMMSDVEGVTTRKQMISDMRWLLAQARDLHLSIINHDQRISTSTSFVEDNSNISWIIDTLSDVRKHKNIVSGITIEGYGYIYVPSLSGNIKQQVNAFYQAVEHVKDTPGVFLDLRVNGGGDELMARGMAGCFIKGKLPYAKNISVDPSSKSGFTPVFTRWFKHDVSGPYYDKPVVVLMGQRCMSSCEALLLMMRAAPNATLLGDRSRGSSGNPRRYELMNGLFVVLPSWQAMTLDGECFEGVGIEPDVYVASRPEEFRNYDPVYEAAVVHMMNRLESEEDVVVTDAVSDE